MNSRTRVVIVKQIDAMIVNLIMIAMRDFVNELRHLLPTNVVEKQVRIIK